MKSDRRTILRIIWILGALVFILLLARIGPDRIWVNIARLTPAGFILLFALRTLYWVFRTYIWRTILAGDTPPPGFGRLFVALMAGHAVSYLTPSAYLGGEAVRTIFVGGTDRKRVFASVVVDTTFEILSLAFFTAGGAAFIAAGSALPVPARIGLTAFMIGMIAGLLFLIRRQRRGMFIWLIDLLGRIRIRPRFIERNRDKLREVDARISDFYGKGFRTVGRVFALNLMLHGFWVAEIHLTLAFLGAPELTLPKSFLAVTLGAIGLLLPTTPASLGTYEAANLAVFAGLGWSAGLSLSLSLVRRALSLFWAGIGLLFIAWRGRTKSSC
jgi:glycosyltransferase 2 family protein